MRVSKRAYLIASKYKDSTYIEIAGKQRILDDLSMMGVNACLWLDESTVKGIAKVVSTKILENGVSK